MHCVVVVFLSFFLSSVFEAVFTNYPVIGILLCTRMRTAMILD
jgi:hypothetical protein